MFSRADFLRMAAREREAHLMAEQLASCGVRPKMIYQLLRGDLSINEVKRLHDLTSPLKSNELQGRLIKAAVVSKFSDGANKIAVEALDMVALAIDCGAHAADAISATWRLLTEREDLPSHSRIHDVGCEDLVVLWFNLQTHEIRIRICNECGTRFLSTGFAACQVCCDGGKRVKVKKQVA